MREVEAALAAEEHGRAASRSSTAGSARAARYRRGTKRRRPHEPPLAASATATLEREALQRGLGSALTSRNVGFRMLARMGFVEGSGLGPPGREGASEPIAISASLASSGGRRGPKRHAGVGRAAEEAVAARAAAAAAAAERARAANASSAQQGDFIAAQRQKAARRRLCARLKKSRRVVRALDERSAVGWHTLWGGADPRSSALSSDEDAVADRDARALERMHQPLPSPHADVDAMDATALRSALDAVASYLHDHHGHTIEWDSDFGE
jgi:hypothetical protein